MANTTDYLNELVNQKTTLASVLVAEDVEASPDETFNTLVEKTKALHNTDQTYNPESVKAQSGIAVAEGIDESVGDINGALSNLVEPSEIDPAIWMDEAVDTAVEEIRTENERTIATQIEQAVTSLSTENEATIKKQVADAVDGLGASIRRSFLTNAKRVTNGNITFEENTIYVIVKVPDDNELRIYDCETLSPVPISDRHYCIIVGNEGDDMPGAVCALLLSYPSLNPHLFVVKKDGKQGSISWTGTAIMSVVKNSLVT